MIDPISGAAGPARLVIASRQSRLAMWQAEHVQARLRALHPDCDVSILPMSTRGDEILDRSLQEIGGKGLFTKELEVALADGRADLAVHSLKDVPMELPEGFELAAILKREDPRDAFVSPRHASLADLPVGARVGTSSLRRAAQLHAAQPSLHILPLRGNLDTRLGKLDRGEYDAIVLAAAGLKRLGLASRIRALIAPDHSLPAAGQGALGIEVLAERADVSAWLAPLADASTTLEVAAERAVSRALGGSCRVPLAAYCTTEGGQLRLRALVASRDGARIARAQAERACADRAQAEALGEAVTRRLREQDAETILAESA